MLFGEVAACHDSARPGYPPSPAASIAAYARPVDAVYGPPDARVRVRVRQSIRDIVGGGVVRLDLSYHAGLARTA